MRRAQGKSLTLVGGIHPLASDDWIPSFERMKYQPTTVVVAQRDHELTDPNTEGQDEKPDDDDPGRVLITNDPSTEDDNPQRIVIVEHVPDDLASTEAVARIPADIK